jgi:hypothetical protein
MKTKLIHYVQDLYIDENTLIIQYRPYSLISVIKTCLNICYVREIRFYFNLTNFLFHHSNI